MSNLSREPHRVLIFSPVKRLIAIVQSTSAAGQILATTPQNVHYACDGRTISCKKFYMRHLESDIEVTMEDMGKLSLEEYDKLCGVKRRVFANSAMSRKGMKYKKSVYKPKKSKKNEETSNGESC